MAQRELVGIDVGGTFTDFVFVSHGRMRIHKSLSPDTRHEESILEGLSVLGVPDDAALVHGTTVATNALLERKGARTALITTSGFEDVIELGRQQRPELYRFSQSRRAAVIPSDLRFGVEERLDEKGQIITALNEASVSEIIERLRNSDVESIAVVLLFSYQNADHERRIANRLTEAFPGIHISISSRLIPEYREYERTATTAGNAYVSPVVARYVRALASTLGSRSFLVMHSGGGSVDAETAANEGARLALSGPAGGVIGAFEAAKRAGISSPVRIITFDMGGTSTDVCLCDGSIPLTSEAIVADLPLKFPAVDIDTVGAGGGSIAWVDDGGVLRVGPESAGAFPGPACYGQGGARATVTDANLILGRLDVNTPLGDGSIKLHKEPALQSLEMLGHVMGLSVYETALGVVRVANATMERALRRVSISRGHDPRQFCLVPFGGAGPLHVCALASALEISSFVVPEYPGVLSAAGLCAAGVVFDRSASLIAGIDDLKADPAPYQRLRDGLKREVDAYMHAHDCKGDIEWSVDLRYLGQSYELTVPIEPSDDPVRLDEASAAFHAAHEQRFGYAMEDFQVEMVTLRARGRSKPRPWYPSSQHNPDGVGGAASADHPVWFENAGPLETPFIHRDELLPGEQLNGPAVIHQMDSTFLLEPGWRLRVADNRILHCTRTPDSSTVR